MSTARTKKSRLAGAMAAKASIPSAEGPEAGGVEAAPAAPVAEEPAPAPAPPVAPEPPAPPAAPEATPTAEPPAPPTAPIAEEPVPVPAPEATPEPPVAPVTEPVPAPLQKAQVLAGVAHVDIETDLKHLKAIVASGRDQRRYVENLPRRSEKGTYVRLPVHLQDVLAEYCDRNEAPMGDLVAAILDSYFRDIGALPPLGEGHRPIERFFAKIRRETRTYDY